MASSSSLQTDSAPVCFFSWNVNGYKDSIHSTIRGIITQSNPDVIFLSETKKSADILNKYFSEFKDYIAVVSAHTPHQYHGVAMLIRNNHRVNRLSVNMGIECRKDSKGCKDPSEGRVLLVQIDNMVVVGTYIPNSGVDGNEEKLIYRTGVWDKSMYSLLEQLRAPTNNQVVWLGDINVAPVRLDISNKKMETWAGYTPGERSNFSEFIKKGWVDIWRYQHPNAKEFTWRGKLDSTTYGMRLDNIIVPIEMLSKVNSSFICHNCQGSDHVPVGAYIYP